MKKSCVISYIVLTWPGRVMTAAKAGDTFRNLPRRLEIHVYSYLAEYGKLDPPLAVSNYLKESVLRCCICAGVHHKFDIVVSYSVE